MYIALYTDSLSSRVLPPKGTLRGDHIIIHVRVTREHEVTGHDNTLLTGPYAKLN